MRRILVTLGAVAVVGSTLVASPAAAGARRTGPPFGPITTSESRLADAMQPRRARIDAVRQHRTALPTWSSSFVSNGATYPYTMVGTDPAAGSATTAVRTEILPLRLTFDGGVTLDGTDVVQATRLSPMFKSGDYRSGRTQYGDAMQRASFWDDVSTVSPRYHVLLSEPKVLDTVSLQVPPSGGFVTETPNGPAGTVTTAYLTTLLPQLSAYYDPSALLIIVVKDVRGEDFLGFHFSFTPEGRSAPMTFIFTGYFTPGVLVAPTRADSYVLSHEVQEWINDPYVTNSVPAWRDPASGTCFNDLLEVGDAVEFLPTASFTVRSAGRDYHVTDVAGISWFAHDVPSRELGAAYSYDGNLTEFSALC
ncbi:MAG: hypothetical protein ACXVJX_09270 [Acidimicrobiia bacterium]